jgi:hypothetical protein
MTDQPPAPETAADAAGKTTPETLYLIMAEMGTEGPYTLAKLRDLLVQGRVRSTDRVMDAQSRTIVPLAEVIEGAGKISELRPALKEQARQQSQRRKAELLAKPPPTAETPVEAPAPPPDSAVAEFQRREVKRRHVVLRGVGVVAIVLAVLAAGWWLSDGLHLPGSGGSGGPIAITESKALTAFADWQVTASPIPELAGAKLTLSQQTLVITLASGTTETLPLGGFALFAPGAFLGMLRTPHPLLGAQFTVVVDGDRLRLLLRKGEISCARG